MKLPVSRSASAVLFLIVSGGCASSVTEESDGTVRADEVSTRLAASSLIDQGGVHVCARGPSGWKCFGTDISFVGPHDPPPPPWSPRPQPDYADVALLARGHGDDLVCKATMGDGHVYCKGDFSLAGELGLGAITSTRTFRRVGDLSNVVSISTSRLTVCAVERDRGIQCWGQGPLGNGTDRNSNVPVEIAGTQGATEVSVGSGHVCAVFGGGDVRCWGRNYGGSLGNGTTVDTTALTPQRVRGIDDAISVASGHYDSCALLAGGRVKCWGSNLNGSLGSASTSTDSGVPVVVDGVVGATAVALSYDYLGGGVIGPTRAHEDGRAQVAGAFGCALVAGGRVKCWGDNRYGQLGNGRFDREPSPAAEVVGLSGAKAIALGISYACAALADGSVKCWGSFPMPSAHGNDTTSNVPVAIPGMR